MHIFILIVNVVKHGSVWSGLMPPLPPACNCLACNSSPSTPPSSFLGGSFGVFTKQILSVSPGVGKLVISACSLPPPLLPPFTWREGPQDPAAEVCELRHVSSSCQEVTPKASLPFTEAPANTNFPRKSLRSGDTGNESCFQSSC